MNDPKKNKFDPGNKSLSRGFLGLLAGAAAGLKLLSSQPVPVPSAPASEYRTGLDVGAVSLTAGAIFKVLRTGELILVQETIGKTPQFVRGFAGTVEYPYNPQQDEIYVLAFSHMEGARA